MPTHSKPGSMNRKAVYAVMIAGLLGATALTGTISHAGTQATKTQISLNTAPASGFADLVENVMPSVVSVQSKYTPAASRGEDGARGQRRQFQFGFPQGSPFERFFRNQPGRNGGAMPQPHRRNGTSQGSGFIISEDGFAVTNNHVIKGASEVTVKFADGRELDAKVIGTDPKTDLALLKIDSGDKFTPVKFASEKPRVGDWVVAVGNPFGLGGTVTTGIISAAGRDIGAGPYDNFLQIDAPINRGNSGGPAFNLKGEVVGVNTAIFSPSGGSVGIGFAIPASTAEDIIADLQDDGNVTRGWLGVQIQKVSEDIASSIGLDKPSGTLVAAVTDGSPAEKSGLRTGDTILKVNGADIKGPKELSRAVARLKPGTAVDMTVFRDGKQRDIKVSIGEMPGEKQASLNPGHDSGPAADEKLGLALAPAEDGDGVVVADVMPGSPAAEQGIRRGDVILEVDGAFVDQPEAAVAAIRQSSAKSGKSPVLLLVKNDRGQRFVALKIAKG
ncbi:Do family serine endopeptidase [Anderseniella sp. Alg231-50]|uniref:Do family serine endopeptidase n=1 Tax=Anderseniella sp. Alg231-50 TaxID=1922226 RepID=UPI000D54EDAE